MLNLPETVDEYDYGLKTALEGMDEDMNSIEKKDSAAAAGRNYFFFNPFFPFSTNDCYSALQEFIVLRIRRT